MTVVVVDDMHRRLVFSRSPGRIVSLVPSDTYSLFALGVGDRVVGRTRFCVEPAGEVDSIPVIGGTKDVDVEAVLELRPDLVLANQEENARRPLEDIALRGVPVLVSFPRRVADGMASLARLARVLGIAREDRVRDLVRRGYEEIRRASAAIEKASLVPTFVPIWMDPLMTFSADTFADDMLHLCGAQNVFADRQRRYPLAADLGRSSPLSADQVGLRDVRYPRVTLEEVEERTPELILLPDEPHSFSETDADVFRDLDVPAARTGAIRFCDGKDLFWPGARSVDAIPRLKALIAAASST